MIAHFIDGSVQVSEDDPVEYTYYLNRKGRLFFKSEYGVKMSFKMKSEKLAYFKSNHKYGDKVTLKIEKQ